VSTAGILQLGAFHSSGALHWLWWGNPEPIEFAEFHFESDSKNGWAVYELATRRVVELDGVAQAGLRFAAAEQAARLLNSFGCDIASADQPSQ
jgi:hypothetical protein